MGGKLCRGIVAAAVLSIVAVAPAAAAPRSSALWTSAATPKAKARAVRPAHSRSFTLDRSGMRRTLAAAPRTLALPAPWPLADCPAAFGNTDIWAATTG